MDTRRHLVGRSSGRGNMRRGSRITFASVVVALVAVACGPPPPPPPTHEWVTTALPRTATPTGTTNFFGAWTSENWFATLKVTTETGTPPGAELLFHPRSGPGNSSLGAPQSLIPMVDPSFGGPAGDELVGLVGSSAMEFFREAGGSWSSVGTFSYPGGFDFRALSDDWLVMADLPVSPGVASQVFAFPLDSSGASVVVGAPQSISADPSWPQSLQDGFGVEVVLDGDLMAVRAQDQFAGSEPGVLLLRNVAGAWTPELSLGGQPGGPVFLGQSLDVDDGPTIDRLAIQVADPGSVPRVDVYVDDGAGFVLEQSIIRDTSEPDDSNGLTFGSELALEGSLLAVNGRRFTVASEDPGHAPVDVTTVQLFGHGASWQREEEVRPFTDPAPGDIRSASPVNLQVTGDHVAASVLIAPDPPPGCTFPCYILGSEAWSIDRTN